MRSQAGVTECAGCSDLGWGVRARFASGRILRLRLGSLRVGSFKSARHVGLGEIRANEEKWATVEDSQFVGEAIGEIETCGVNAFAKSGINSCGAPRASCRNGDFLQSQLVDQHADGFDKVAAFQDNEDFR